MSNSLLLALHKKGSGKTTLLNHILNDPTHGMRFAVIENEIGEIGVDEKILSENLDEEIIEVMNGCICCKVRGDLIEALKRLYSKVETFDGIIIETTGLADPAPVVQTFFSETSEELIEEMYKLDCVITVTDAKYIMSRLDEVKPVDVDNEAQQQICFADKIILNKIDLVENKSELEAIVQRLRSLNPAAPILRAQNSVVSPKELLNVQAFDLEKVLQFDPYFLGDVKRPKHDKAVSSISVKLEGEVNLVLLSNWIHEMLNDYGENLYRYKGIIAVKAKEKKFVFQGVGHMFNGEFQSEWNVNEKRVSTFVFIGKNLDSNVMKSGFMACREVQELRFAVGTKVLANVGSYQLGIILNHWEDGHAYRIRLHNGHEVFASVDIDEYVKAEEEFHQKRLRTDKQN